MNATLNKPEGKALSAANVTRDGQPFRVCFVCTGNTCRSPMAQAVANALLNTPEFQRAKRQIRAHSAGLYAVAGDPISPNAVLALERAGITPTPSCDYHAHRAHTLSQEEAERYDLLVGISESHVMELILRFPALTSRVTVLAPPVSDPYGSDLARYEDALSDIVTGVRRLLSLPTEEI